MNKELKAQLITFIQGRMYRKDDTGPMASGYEICTSCYHYRGQPHDSKCEANNLLNKLMQEPVQD